MDLRIAWLRERILSYLGFEDNELFNNMLETNDGELHEKLISFLNEPICGSEANLEKTLFHVHRTYYDKLVQVEKEITEWRIVPPTLKLTTPPHSSKRKGKSKAKPVKKVGNQESESSAVDPDTVVDETGNEDVQEFQVPDTIPEDAPAGKGHGILKKKQSAVNVEEVKHVSMEVTMEKSETSKVSVPEKTQTKPPELDPEVDGTVEYYTLKRFVPMMMKLPKFNGGFGQIGENTDPTTKFVYVMRLTESPIDIPDSDASAKQTMCNNFIVGSCSGKFLKSLWDVLKQPYNEFLELKLSARRNSENEDSPKVETLKVESKNNQQVPNMNFNRYSHYYRLSTRAGEIGSDKGEENGSPDTISDSKISVHAETPKDLQSLIDSVEWTYEHTEGVTHLPIPNLPQLSDAKLNAVALATDKDLIETLEETVATWCTQISDTIEASLIKNMEAEGPLDEYNFWNTHHTSLSNLNEQLNTPLVQYVITILTNANSASVTLFDVKKEKLIKKYLQARENVEFLSTLLRYFTIITESPNLKEIGHSISGLINGLNMLWILSEFYSKDENMVALLERIAYCLCQKIEVHLSVQTLFLLPCTDIYTLAVNAKNMLEMWKKCYMSTRQKIEHSGKGARWEFDRRKLFHRTDYLANVCDDLAKVATVLIQFENIFGNEFKSILKEQTEIKKIIKLVQQLVYPIQTVDFSLFKPDNKENWDVIINEFYKEVTIVEEKAKIFIDDCYDNLRSSEEAVEMLLKLMTLDIRESIRELLMMKFDVIMQQFMKEITTIQTIFNECKDNPPLLHNHPPVAGAIFWSRSLCKKLNKSKLLFEKITQLDNSEQKLIAFSYYKTLKQTMTDYENKKFNEWIQNSTYLINKSMKKKLLKVVRTNDENQVENTGKGWTVKDSVVDLKESNSKNSLTPNDVINYELYKKNNKIKLAQLVTLKTQSKNLLKWTPGKNIKKKETTTWRDIQENHLLIDYNLKYQVNFTEELFEIIYEAEIMEYLVNIDLPPTIRQCAMQKDRLHDELEKLEAIVKEYNDLQSKLVSFEYKLIRDHLYDVEKHLYPGLERITWTSLGIMDYIKNSKHSIEFYKSIYKQLSMINGDINTKIDKLEHFNLFPIVLPDADESISCQTDQYYSCKVFFEMLENLRTEMVSEMVHTYETIGPILIKLEYLMLGTSTGQSRNMLDVYQYWELNIFEMFVRFCILNMHKFNDLLNGDESLFQIDATLLAHSVAMDPDFNDVINILIHSVNDFVQRLNMFPRWKRASCHLYEAYKKTNSDQIVPYSFYEDVVKVQAINDFIDHLHKVVKTITLNVKAYIQKWNKYESLWLCDKQFACEKYVRESKEIVMFDERFTFYENIIDELNEHVDFINVGCIRVNLKPIINEIQNHAMGWKNTLGECLTVHTVEKMNSLKNIINKLRKNLNVNIKGLKDFKLVMITIAQIKKMTITTEVIYKAMQETFNILRSHDIKVNVNDSNFAHALENDWHALYISSIFRSEKLNEIKEKFSNLTLNEVNEFLIELQQFVDNFNSNGPGNVDDLDKGLSLMQEYLGLFEDFENRLSALSSAEQLFDNPLADYSIFFQAHTDYISLEAIYDVYQRQKVARKEWGEILWADLDAQVLINGIDNFIKEFRKLPKNAKEMPCGVMILTIMRQFKGMVPLMVSLKNSAMKDRHWKELMEKTGQSFDMSPDTCTLEQVFSMKLHEYQTIAETIVNHAIKELSIEKGINDVVEIWNDFNLSVTPYLKNGKERGFTLNPCDEIVALIDDHCMNLQSMAASQFVGPFLSTVQTWEKNLSTISDVIEAWLIVQQKWLYLEGIFIGTDIRLQLPDEAEKFDVIDAAYITNMIETSKQLSVMKCCLEPGKLEFFLNLSKGLDQSQKSLNQYLDSKKRIFPRFFFISTDELLSILGNPDPRSVQDHMIKMFDNIKALAMSRDKADQPIATALISGENEIMEFQEVVHLDGYVENWMNLVVQEMKRCNRTITKNAIYDYGKNRDVPRTEWILKYHGMVCLAANSVWWTAETEEAFASIKSGNKVAMREYLTKLNDQLSELIIRVRQDLSPNDRKKYKTITTMDVHARDIIEEFVKENVCNSQEFQWESQLRLYWMKEIDNLQIRQCTGYFNYGYEYMGLNGRLVVTPLTGRIYLTVTQALTMYLGGAPAGPAGTGKTETVKDLAKAFALLCIVTNCGEGMDSRVLGQIFSGLCPTGAWGCFDEFNRIDVSVLSVISTQLQCIRNALMMKVDTFYFEGNDIAFDSRVGIFVTMNPGYAGRTELPESVKALFRPVMCIVPDLELICQISLFSDGFLDAKILAKKMTVLYKVAKEQLSRQSHYDWGLRGLTAVLRMAGNLKRATPDLPENVVLMRALRDMNLPKLIFDDAPLFLGLIKDLFPGLECPRVGYADLNEAVKYVLTKDGYIITNEQVDKVIQLYETMMTRHSTMIVGPTSGGKTVVIHALVNAQTYMGTKTNLITLNPKACNVIELYGILDLTTRDWIDGLYSSIFRNMNKPTDKNELFYSLFDGDVDALWIENMNSVMDDNKLLTLANGERIRLADNCSLLFEVGDLNYASPATISRAGMVYVDPKNLGYLPYWKKWINARTEESEKTILNQLFEFLVPAGIDYIISGIFGVQQLAPLKTIIPQTDLNMVTQLCKVLEGLLQTISDDKEFDEDLVQCIFITALYNSLGATILSENMAQFDEYVKKNCAMMLVDDEPNKKASKKFLPRSFPTMYDYYFNVKDECWEAWEWLVPTYVHDRSLNFSEILVPTVDTLRITWTLKLMESIQIPFLLSGDTGTSKTAIIKHFLRNLNPEKYIIAMLNFSSSTSSYDVQKNLESYVEKKTKGIFGPPMGKKLFVFIDDMNMPQVDQYGTQQPIALLKLLLEKNGFYSRDSDLKWMTLKDIVYVTSMATAGGGRNEVDPRFVSKFSVCNLTFPKEATLTRIYLSILDGHLETFPIEVQDISKKLMDMTLELFNKIIVELPPTPSKFHYIFNLRDLSRIVGGMCLTHPTLFPEPKYFIRVWRNEFCRVICDRLISIEDQNLMQDHIATVVGTYFCEDELTETQYLHQQREETERTRESMTPAQASDSEIIADLGLGEMMSEEGLEEEELALDKQKELTLEEYILRDPLLFGDYRNAINDDGRYYEDLLDYDAIYYLFQEILEEYNESLNKIPLVLFEDCLEHLTRVHRIIRMDRGHMLLIGSGSSGKRSIVKLAAYAAGASIFEITTTRGYNEASFKEDLKSLFNMLGVEKKKCVFLLSSLEIVEEIFLEYINNILMNGFVPSLFTDAEKDEIVNLVRDDAVKAGYNQGKISVWDYFCNLCATNLHVIFTTASGDVLKNRCRSFPGLVNNTTINWLFPWPKQALEAVANICLVDVAHIPEQYREKIVQYIVDVHIQVTDYTVEFMEKLKRFNYVTPKHYIDFIENYLKLLNERHDFIIAQCERLDNGLLKIDEANGELISLNTKLATQKVVLEEQTNAVQVLIKKISIAKIEAEEKERVASKRSEEISEEDKIISIQKLESEKVLSVAMPAVENARQALEALEKADITEIRSFATPPEAVQIVCECILIIRGIKELSWKSCRAMMSDPSFLRHLLEMDCNQISQQQVKAVKTHLKTSKRLETMGNISKAGLGLLNYVMAVLDYCAVYKEVKPKIEKVEKLEKEHNKAMQQLNKLNTEIDKIKFDLQALNDEYEKVMNSMRILETEGDIMAKRFVAAEKLMSGLTSEQLRWREELKGLHLEKSRLIGNCLISSGFLSYLGPFTFECRTKMIHSNWIQNIQQKNIPLTMPYKLETNLSNDVEISKWNSDGLPSDELSVQNGILTLRASRFPLCVDPQTQALKWIKKMETKNNLRIMTLNDSDYLKKLEMSVKYGIPVLIQDVDENIDPIINNILEKKIQLESGRQFIILGNQEIDYDPNFRLYLTTKLSNPQFNPNVYSKTIIINYLVTLSGLEEQLLGVTIGIERADLEKQRETLIKESSNNKQLLKQLEDSLLYELSSTTGNMLDNVDLVDALENTKSTAVQLFKELELALVTSTDIDVLRNEYRPVAVRGAILFFVLSDMATVNMMYQYSLSSYLEVFEFSLKKTPPATDLSERLEKITVVLTDNFYEFGCTGTFERHKLLFSFLITINLEKYVGNISQSQIDFFIKGSIVLDKTNATCPIPWMPLQSWENLCKLNCSYPDTFDMLLKNLISQSDQWKEWYSSDAPESLQMPSNFSEKLKSFEFLLLLRCLRTDRIYCAINIYIKTIMSEKFITPPVFSFDNIYEQSTPNSLVVFILSAGSDPTGDLMKLGNKIGCPTDEIKYLSLGQGQEPIALELLDSCMTTGHWLILQNCHLLSKFLIVLEKTLDTKTQPHEKFRLWLTTDPTPLFPIGLLQKSIKVVNEPPSGLKLNLQSTFTKLNAEALENCAHPQYKKLVYVLAFFHAVVQERRKYDKIGWNIHYDFSENDFTVCMDILKCYLEKKISDNNNIPWDTLKYLFGEIMYGGRVIDDYDRRIVKTYMEEYFGDFLFDTFQPFYFFHSDQLKYNILQDNNKKGYIKNIDEFPLINSPEVYGLNSNAEINYYTKAITEFWNFLIEMQPQDNLTSSGINKEDFIKSVAEDILSKIPAEYDIIQIRKNNEMRITPSFIVLLQELQRFNQLTLLMSKTLDLLIKALAGEIGMDVVLDNISNSLYNGQVPNEWRQFAPATCKMLGGWMEHFVRRTEQFTSWATKEEPIVIWLSGLQIPESYLTAHVQMACRLYAWPLDHSTQFTRVTSLVNPDDVEERPDSGCYIAGLHLEGARWDIENNCLKRSHPKVLVTELPIVYITPIEVNKLNLLNTLKTPVYVTSLRRNAMGVGLAFESDLNTTEDISQWILQGVCIIMNTD